MEIYRGLKIKPTPKMLVFIHLNMKIVGVTGFEPATTRPPDVYATGLRYHPKSSKLIPSFTEFQAIKLILRLKSQDLGGKYKPK